MKKTIIHSQISNAKSVCMYQRRCLSLAENVFDFENLPEFIDVSFLNKELVRRGSIAFFKDEYLGVLALPYQTFGYVDVYNRPTKIQVYGKNGYKKDLKAGEFVIMYDNNGRYPLYLDIMQISERLGLCKRITDINITQQKTPRIWKTSNENKKSVEDLVNEVDSCVDAVQVYETMEIDDLEVCIAPAPFVTDKIDIHIDKEWAEFYQLVGISSLIEQKKERVIKDEMTASLGGTIASRFNRFTPRQKAIKEINKKWGLDIKVKFYDGLPSMIDDLQNLDDEGDDLDDAISNNE